MNSKTLLSILAAFLFSFQFAAAQPLESPSKTGTEEIRQTIATQLSGMDVEGSSRFTEDIKICFKIQADGMVLLHEVVCNNPQLKQEIKKELKGMKIDTEELIEDQFYWITVKFKVA
ncbi:MAG: hypothetical protein ACI84C_001036 [Flavobacteriales bacterium]|jgi:hypothetical protein